MARNRWAVGSNMPGYMPDTECEHMASLAEAKQYLEYLLCEAIDGECEAGNITEQAADEFQKSSLAYLKKRSTKECNFYLGSYVYWISKL